jgi:NDP-sugar pyrophosphorylase family protein
MPSDRPRIDAVIMAGGKGARLRPLTYAIPKPLLPVGEKPLMEILVGQLKSGGFRRIAVSVGYRAELIQTYFGDGSRFGVELEYLVDSVETGTAGSLAALAGRVDAPVVVVNGDILTRLDFGAFLRAHVESGAALTLAGAPYEVQIPYGVIDARGGTLASVVEKPTLRHLIVAGVYALSPEAIALVPHGRRMDMPELIECVRAAGRPVRVHEITDEWIDIGRMPDLERANGEIARWNPSPSDGA